MIGFRGASRYYSPRYRDGFALECRAIDRLRNTMGFTNIIVMIPFCRSPAEADRVLRAITGRAPVIDPLIRLFPRPLHALMYRLVRGMPETRRTETAQSV